MRFRALRDGVIGNTSASGAEIWGSSPCPAVFVKGPDASGPFHFRDSPGFSGTRWSASRRTAGSDTKGVALPSLSCRTAKPLLRSSEDQKRSTSARAQLRAATTQRERMGLFKQVKRMRGATHDAPQPLRMANANGTPAQPAAAAQHAAAHAWGAATLAAAPAGDPADYEPIAERTALNALWAWRCQAPVRLHRAPARRSQGPWCSPGSPSQSLWQGRS